MTERGSSWPRPPIVADVVRQHVEDATILYEIRTALTNAAHVKLYHLRRFDERLAAHLDGLSIAGEGAHALLEAALELPTPGSVFTAAVRSIDQRRGSRLERLLALAQAIPKTQRGVLSAFGWVEPGQLQGIVTGLLASENQFRRFVGVAACGLHRVDPGLKSGPWLQDDDPLVRARALRTLGELGQRELAAVCASGVADSDPEAHLWAAWSAVLLGNRDVALEALIRTGLTDGANRARAFRLALQAVTTNAAHDVLQALARDPQQLRWLIQGAGIAGDPAYVPWLIGHMSTNETARLAGEAFSLMTGLDLAVLGLERDPPEGFESGPNDNPDDPNVDMDADDSLPWPDPNKIQAWWVSNSAGFRAGTRYFMGAPVEHAHCIEVLKNGYQRQRILAAHYLCLLDPGTRLFNAHAPAGRQQQLLAQM
jgi:uncharacterized protein (TIGR02270 family)